MCKEKTMDNRANGYEFVICSKGKLFCLLSVGYDIRSCLENQEKALFPGKLIVKNP